MILQPRHKATCCFRATLDSAGRAHVFDRRRKRGLDLLFHPLRHLLLREVGRVPRHGPAQLARPRVPPTAPKNKPKQDVPTEPAAPKRKLKPPPVETTPPAEAPAEAPPEAPLAEAPQLTREQQRALRMLERQSAYDRLTTGASVLV